LLGDDCCADVLIVSGVGVQNHLAQYFYWTSPWRGRWLGGAAEQLSKRDSHPGRDHANQNY
jgi:hypothetical protein